jgi:hypothetical protein
MKVSIWSAVIAAILILFCAAAYAKDGSPSGEAADGYIFSLNRKTAETFYEMKEQRLKAVEAKKAEEEEKLKEQEKKGKGDKIQGKTGRTATSWQVLNR